MQDKEYLKTIVGVLVSHPDHLSIERTQDERGVLLTLKTHPDDMGKVIGKAGETAKAIRTLMRVYGHRANAHFSVKIEEPV